MKLRLSACVEFVPVPVRVEVWYVTIEGWLPSDRPRVANDEAADVDPTLVSLTVTAAAVPAVPMVDTAVLVLAIPDTNVALEAPWCSPRLVGEVTRDDIGET